MGSLFPEHELVSDALFSPCQTWRYTLRRIWDRGAGLLMVIGLNPSTADEIKNDPTVTRCVNYARRLGYGGLIMMNAFAFRTPSPEVMRRQAKQGVNVVGPDNDFWLVRMAEDARTIIVAWGNHGLFQKRHHEVMDLLRHRNVYCFGATKQGTPRHPLYLPQDITTLLYRAAVYPRVPGMEDDGYAD